MTDVAAMPSTQWLSREDRRALARRDRRSAQAPRTNGVCLFCYGPLTNGAAECDEGWWRVVPTLDGELWV